MKRLLTLIVVVPFLLALTLSVTTHAQQFRKNQIYAGSKSLTLSYDNAWLENDEVSGYQIGYSRVFQGYFEFRGSYYRLEPDSYSDVTVKGFDLGVVAGNVGPGFKSYAGAGMFSETWENSFSHDFSGIQLIFGIGYNWQEMGLDLTIAYRDAQDYQDFVSSHFDTSTNAAAIASSLNIGFRF